MGSCAMGLVFPIPGSGTVPPTTRPRTGSQPLDTCRPLRCPRLRPLRCAPISPISRATPGARRTSPSCRALTELRAGGAQFARYPTATVLGCPHLVDIVTHADIISVIARHLGAIPTIIEYAAWWSFAGRDAAKDSQLFHFDFPDYRYCLLFLYLTDVDADGGPHIIVEATQEFRHIAEARSRWPGGEAEFDEWYFKNIRKSDADVARYVGGEPATLAGPAGSCFLVNTRGLHKGMRPKRSDRLVCEVVFGVTPHLEQPFEPLPLATAEMAHIPDRLTSPPFDYVNRLFLTP